MSGNPRQTKTNPTKRQQIQPPTAIDAWSKNCLNNRMSILPIVKQVSERILIVRAERVILDADLAAFYGVSTKRLNEQVHRNRGRFPEDFLFRLTPEEKAEVVAKCDHLRKLRYSKMLPLAFTEHGTLMAASVLNSPLAIEASILIVRTFVELRRILAENHSLAQRIDKVEIGLLDHNSKITAITEVLKQLANSPNDAKRRIGFASGEPHEPGDVEESKAQETS